MPTTIDRFFACVQLCQNLSGMSNNMRTNVQTIQAALAAGTIATPAAAQSAYRGLGLAFQQRLTMNQQVLGAFPAQINAGMTAIGVAPADVTAVQANLVTWAGNLAGAVVTSTADSDALVANVLANVPATIQVF